MNIRFENLQRKAASAVAALALSTFFIGAAVGPAVSQPGTVDQAQLERVA
jgi:hypothetical protein